MKNTITIIFLLIFIIGCNSLRKMETKNNYYLLKKNNGLQTIVSLINPYVFATKDKEEIELKKKELELKYLRETPVDFHFNHHEVVCDKEMIAFDKYLIEEFEFSFLSDGFDHNSESLNGQIVYGKKFPNHLTDEELLTIQKKMNKHHFELLEVEPNGRFIILLNPTRFDNPLRDGEIYALTKMYDSKEEVETLMEEIVQGNFDAYGTVNLVGYIHDDELNQKTKQILESQNDIIFKSIKEDYGQQFVSEKKLKEIPNGHEILIQLLESVNRRPYEIIQLK